MMRWRALLFGFLSRNAQPATAFFGLPVGRVVELGVQVELGRVRPTGGPGTLPTGSTPANMPA